MISTNPLHKKCLICKGGRKNDCLYVHLDEKTGLPWIWCSGICQRGYSLQQYCDIAGVDIEDFIAGGIEIVQDVDNEVQAMAWPAKFISLADPRAKDGVDYIKSRGLNLDGDMYYDIEERGIVFPMYYLQHYCGAQVRFLEERIRDDGNVWKITTVLGTRLGLLLYGWNQTKFMAQVKGVIVCEGAFNALTIQQALNLTYGGISANPWRVVSCSGSGASEIQREAIRGLKEAGYKIIVAPDTDEAGFKMYDKFLRSESITHCAFTGDSERDWNNYLKKMGHAEFAKFFLSCIRPVEV